MFEVTASQLFAHAVGDYVLQSDWMAQNKSKSWPAILVHVLLYTLPFALWFQPSWQALVVICVTHLVIDRWRLARYVIWLRNWMAAPGTARPWAECTKTGFPDTKTEREPHMAIWLLIIVDNLMHVAINAAALQYL